MKCDASKQRLVAAYEQFYTNGCKHITYDSTFLNEAELNHSIIELELLICSGCLGQNYLFGSPFKIFTAHKLLLSCFSEEKKSKTTHMWLARWVDRLLTFEYELELIPGKRCDSLKIYPGTPIETLHQCRKWAKLLL